MIRAKTSGSRELPKRHDGAACPAGPRLILRERRLSYTERERALSSPTHAPLLSGSQNTNHQKFPFIKQSDGGFIAAAYTRLFVLAAQSIDR